MFRELEIILEKLSEIIYLQELKKEQMIEANENQNQIDKQDNYLNGLYDAKLIIKRQIELLEF